MSRSKYFAIVGVALAQLTAGCASVPAAPAPVEQPGTQVRNIVFMIADGAGIGYWSAAGHAREAPAFATMPVVGLVDTRSANSRVTDSAAGATAYATGERVTNRVVGMTGCPQPAPREPVTAPPPGCRPVESWFEIAREKGMATGVVTTTRVVDASPAAFVAHAPSRYWYEEIAEQFAAADLDVVLGGGRAYFEAATRQDGRDVLGAMCAAADCVFTQAELSAYRPGDRPLVGLFAPDDLEAVEGRPVSLPGMVEAALARLSRDPDGFVAVFETEGTDNAGHAMRPLEEITAEMLDFDDALARVLEFADRNPGTLVIVIADHDTGGFALEEGDGPHGLTGAYISGRHTAALVPVFARGPQAGRFGGVLQNSEVGRNLKAIVSAR